MVAAGTDPISNDALAAALAREDLILMAPSMP